VPDILLSGDHEAVARWRAEQSALRSKQAKEQNTCQRTEECHEE
jgi:tRNA G37 N-methylase TrmD